MDLIGRNCGTITPVKDPKPNSRSKNLETPKKFENSNPNYLSPDPKLSAKKSQKSATKIKNPNFASICSSPSPKKKIRERKFVVAKKNVKREESKALGVDCKCNANGGKSLKCLCVAYENLRASQEGFFNNNRVDSDGIGVKREDEVDPTFQNSDFPNGCEEKLGKSEGEEQVDLVLITNPRNPKGGEENLGESSERGRGKLLDSKGIESGVAEPGSGRVLSLVKAFENLLVMPKSKKSDDDKGMKWGLPALDYQDNEGQVVSSSSFCPSDFVFTSESLGLNSSRVSSLLDGSQISFGVSSRNSGGGQRSRRKSCDSSSTFGGRQCKRRNRKVTSQKPFNLRTEQRGRFKEEEFSKKVQEMMMEEEKLRIPVAQGLPWTTDEPECLAKPPVKECTRPLDLVLHSDVRAVERAEFNHQVIEKMSFVEQYRTEKERQQKFEEEEEIRRLRKELVPRAQPMPYFDRPFIPRRSDRHPTIPKEPRFHLPQNKKIKSCMSWSEMYAHQQSESCML